MVENMDDVDLQLLFHVIQIRARAEKVKAEKAAMGIK